MMRNLGDTLPDEVMCRCCDSCRTHLRCLILNPVLTPKP